MGRKLRKCAVQAMVLNGYGREMKAKALLMNPSYGGIITPEKNFFQACAQAF